MKLKDACYLEENLCPGGEQDGKGVGGRGVHLSPQIHQAYTFRARSACTTPESGQEYLTSRKYTEPRKNSVGLRN